MAYATINPYTGETLQTFPDATDAEVTAAIGKAHEAFLAWKDTSFAERARILQNAADILRKDSDAFARVLTLEMGKLFAEAKSRGRAVGKNLRILCAQCRNLAQAGETPGPRPCRGRGGSRLRTARRAAGDRAVELPLLPDRPHSGAAAFCR
jgi:succinate-semialdehyde dehydrogenase/glutarate-semialdehyde dehydrogenase